MALSNLSGWNEKAADLGSAWSEAECRQSSACGSACGSGDKPDEKPSACGSACGAGDEPDEKPAACGSACGAGDK